MMERQTIIIDLDRFLLHADVPRAGIQICLDFTANPARKFHLSVIAFVVAEMKRLTKVIPVSLEKHYDLLAFLDKSLSGHYRSKDQTGLFEKLTKAWGERLPNLAKRGLFKPLDRDWTKDADSKNFYYEIPLEEQKSWEKLINIWGSGENASLKLAIDEIGLNVDDVTIEYKGHEGQGAWDNFMQSLYESDERKEHIPLSETRQGLKAVDVEDKCTKLDFQDKLRVIANGVEDLSKHVDKSEVESFFPFPPVEYIHHKYPLQKNFTGRDKERRMLSKWYEEGQESMVVLHAMGGMGKSCLAWYWMQEDVLKKGKRRDGIVWWSFYEKDSSFEIFVNNSLKYVSKRKVEPENIKYLGERIDRLYHTLRKNRFLLILDGVERLLRYYARLDAPYIMDTIVKEGDDQTYRNFVDMQCGNFIQSLADKNMESRVVLTSRLFPVELEELEGCKEKKLSEFSLDDAHNFFHLQGLEWTRAEVELVCNPSGYLPLSLRLLTGVIMKDPLEPGEACPEPKEIIARLNREGKRGRRHIVKVAYDSLSGEQQSLLSDISALRYSADQEAVFVLSPGKKKEFIRDTLAALIDRGLLVLDKEKITYDMHPVVRAYSYDRLKDKEGTHKKLRDYFDAMPKPKKAEVLEDLNVLIELYYHTLRTKEHYNAARFFVKHLIRPLYNIFGAVQLCIELLLEFFPDGVDKLPDVEHKTAQAWILAMLKACYSASGQYRLAIRLGEKLIGMRREQGRDRSVAAGLISIALNQVRLGELKRAKVNLRDSIQFSIKLKDKYMEAHGHRTLGSLLAYEGNWLESEKEHTMAFEYFDREDRERKKGVVLAHRSLACIMEGDFPSALEFAQKARELAEEKSWEQDIIRNEGFLGASYRGLFENNPTKRSCIEKANQHTTEALARCRKINLVMREPNILLELARIRRLQMKIEEAKKLAEEALKIANRCEHRLQQADIHLFLAQLALARGDRATALDEVEIAIERASCGYKPTIDRAKTLKEGILQKGH